MSNAQIQRLEREASEQRKQLVEASSQLRDKLEATRQKFSVARIVQSNFALISTTASALAFLVGYAISDKLRGR